MEAAFAIFAKKGYAAASTLEIASRARVSKRELYAIVGTKQTLLVECISRRAARMRIPAGLPAPTDAATFERVLLTFGSRLVTEISDPAVIGVFRLAIAEAAHAPEVARTLDSIGRAASRSALRNVMEQARSCGLIDGQPAERAEQFAGLLWGNLMVSLLLGVAERPSPGAIRLRARDATEAFLRLAVCRK
ncbi:MAG TPA: TetR/AcrR family transcriptional regulator [Rhizomicrobium sp.]|nr:TetR/AcrR family transcriptional regulator [Rhizomicrobium sp.]